MGKAFASIGRFLRREFAEAWPAFLFFLVGFLILLLIIKLALATFSIEMTALSKAVVGAAIAAKAVLILDATPLAARLEHRRRIIAVVVKTFLYGFVTLLLGYAERFVDAIRHEHNVDGAIRYLTNQASMYRLLSWATGVSLVFAIYFTLFEISRRMGDGELRRLFFDSPKTSGNARTAQASPD